jgi:nucleoside-diphosphate-sugar epimerase
VRVLITGGVGSIGSHLAEELLARAYQVQPRFRLVPTTGLDEIPLDVVE